ncbi:MAG: MerR family DNA-binding transcriptional regulator [Candidatus Paceibacterota bacterium]
MNDSPKLISIKEAAKMLGITPLTLRNWDKNGKLPALRHPMNNYRVYKREDIDRLLEVISMNTKPVEMRKRKIQKKLQVIHLDQ